MIRLVFATGAPPGDVRALPDASGPGSSVRIRCEGVFRGAYAALVPDTKAMLGVSDAASGSLMLAAPRLAPAFGGQVIGWSVVMLAGAFALPGWFAAPVFFALSMVLVGAANRFLDVIMTTRVSATETRHGIHLMNLSHAVYSFGCAASAVATGVARTMALHPAQVLTSPSVLVPALSFLAIERGEGIQRFSGSPRSRPQPGMVPVRAGPIVLVAFLSENAAENWPALHIERTLGGSAAQGSFGPALLALTIGFGRIAGARMTERVLVAAGGAVSSGGLVIVALAPDPSVVYAGLLVMGAGGAVIAPTGLAVAGRLSPEPMRARVLARVTAPGHMGYFSVCPRWV